MAGTTSNHAWPSYGQQYIYVSLTFCLPNMICAEYVEQTAACSVRIAGNRQFRSIARSLAGGRRKCHVWLQQCAMESLHGGSVWLRAWLWRHFLHPMRSQHVQVGLGSNSLLAVPSACTNAVYSKCVVCLLSWLRWKRCCVLDLWAWKLFLGWPISVLSLLCRNLRL